MVDGRGRTIVGRFEVLGGVELSRTFLVLRVLGKLLLIRFLPGAPGGHQLLWRHILGAAKSPGVLLLGKDKPWCLP